MCSYCMYAPHVGYRKNTHFWTNLPLELKMCDKKCPGYANGRHTTIAQRGNNHSRAQLYNIPDELCDVIAKAVEEGMLSTQGSTYLNVG